MFKKTLFTLSAIIIFVATLYVGSVYNMKSHISESVLRLHIMGESDTDRDQNLKILVRNRILNDFGGLFSECTSLDDSIKTANKYKNEIESSASDELVKNGCFSSVTANVSKCRFPTKIYENIALPGGEYTALNIKIGDAKGKNWWCVMYPPLCVGKNTVKLDGKASDILKSALSSEEYRLVTESDSPNIKFKFKIAEILGEYIK